MDDLPVPTYVENEAPVPTYSEHEGEDFLSQAKRTSGLILPITRVQDAPVGLLATNEESFAARNLFMTQKRIVDSFFSHVENQRNEVVARYISEGIVSPDVINSSGETPLLAAVRVSNIPMISTLVSLGALVDGYGKTSVALYNDYDYDPARFPLRTPLQFAAEQGKLAEAKVLFKDYGADDSLVAPDGGLALRLAAQNGHREIVALLPARRGGAWLRWKTAHRREMKKFKEFAGLMKDVGKLFFWRIPRYFLYTLPRKFLKALWDVRHWPKEIALDLWGKRHRFPGWAKRQILKTGDRLKRGGKMLWRGVKEIPNIVRRMLVSTWAIIKKIPKAAKMIIDWLARGVTKAGKAILYAFTRILSLLHTVSMAFVTFFQAITLKDVQNGLYIALKAVLAFPQSLWSFVWAFGQVSYDALAAVLGFAGKVIWFTVYCLWKMVTAIPKKLWELMESIGRLCGRAGNECMVFFNPKRV